MTTQADAPGPDGFAALAPELLVKAGAIVPVLDGPAPDGSASDSPAPTGTAAYQARTYTHPALGDRAVVRLVADELAPAEDRLLGFFGFEAGVDGVPIGLGRRRALGFPAWAVVNDPDNAAAAFALVPVLEDAKRTMRSSPGNAKDQLSWAGERLSTSAPRLAPSFYEEGGRAFIAEGNLTMAAAMFAKARTAEAMYGLSVDEGARVEAFLEFALAGALSAKALDEYARTLSQVRPAAEAYQTFRQLAVQRTLGGLPPWTGMVATLKRLARAAGVDADADAAAVLAEMSASPAFGRASVAFWRAAKATVIAAGRDREDVRLALLRTTPDLGYSTDDATTLWLEILVGSGATEHLTSTTSPLLGTGGPADWLSRTCSITHARNMALEQLLLAMRDRLVADGKSFVPAAGYRSWTAHLDLIDLALELGVPVAGPAERVLDLGRWLAETSEHRDLLALMADRDYGRVIDEAVEGHLRVSAADDLLRVEGLRVAVGRWLTRQAATTRTATVADLAATWKTTVSRLTPEVVALDPVAAQAVVATDFAGVLVRTLNGGLLDELGWPALEKIIDSAPADAAVSFSVRAPHLVVKVDGRVVVVDADQVVLTHDLPAAAAATRYFRVLHVDGALLLVWRDSWNDAWQACWSDDPRSTFELADDPEGYSVPAPGGGVTLGGQTLRRGDRSVDTRGVPVFSDGTTTWRLDYERGGPRCHEFDPTSATRGRPSLPAFFQQGAAVGDLLLWSCRLYPSLAGPSGQWAAVLPDGQVEVQDTSGRRFRGRTAGAPSSGRRHQRHESAQAPEALLARPGTDDPLLVFGHRALSALRLVGGDGATVLADLTVGQRASLQAAGAAVVVPAEMMTNLRPRDVPASARLRTLSGAQAGRLLAAARAELRSMPFRVEVEQVPTMTQTRAVALELLGGDTHPRLVAGVVGMTLLAGVLESQRPTLTPPSATTRSARGRGLNDHEIGVVAGGLVPSARGWWSEPATTMADDLERAGQALARVQPAAPVDADPAVQPEPTRQPEPPTPPVEAAPPKPAKGLLSRIGRALKGSPSPSPQPSSPVPTPPGDPVPDTSVPDTSVLSEPVGPAMGAQWKVARPEDLVGNGAALELIPLLPVIAYRSTLGVTPVAERNLLRQFLTAWTTNELATQLPHLRLSTASYPEERGVASNVVLTCETGRHVQARSRSYYRNVVVLEWFDSEPHPLPGTTTTSSISLTGRWGDVGQTSTFLDRSADETLDWSAEAVEHLAGRTGLPRGSAALILAGLPGVDSSDHNFLPREVREALGLKAAEAHTGRDQLKQLSTAQQVDLMIAVAGDPLRLWQESPTDRAERAASWWLSTFGRQVAVGEALRMTAKAYTFGYRTADSVQVAETVAAPESSPLLQADSALLDGTMLWNLVSVAVAAGQQAPVGDPVRRSAGRTLSALRARCEQPGFYVSLGTVNTEPAKLDVTALPAIRAPFPLAPGWTAHPAPPLLLVHIPDRATAAWAQVGVYLHPAQLEATSPEAPVVAAELGFHDRVVDVVDWLTGPAGADLIDDLLRDDLEAGSSTLDPRLVAPATVQQVREHHGLSEDAATLYLQVLALPAPTTKVLTTANRWTSARLKKVAAELVERELLVAGKRARAQREVFLPGRWNDAKIPNLPIESWKEQLLKLATRTELAATARSYGSTLSHLLVPTSAGEHFRRSWQRVVDGDGPGGPGAPATTTEEDS